MGLGFESQPNHKNRPLRYLGGRFFSLLPELNKLSFSFRPARLHPSISSSRFIIKIVENDLALYHIKKVSLQSNYEFHEFCLLVYKTASNATIQAIRGTIRYSFIGSTHSLILAKISVLINSSTGTK